MSTCFMFSQTQGGIHVPYSVSTPTANEEGGGKFAVAVP